MLKPNQNWIPESKIDRNWSESIGIDRNWLDFASDIWISEAKSNQFRSIPIDFDRFRSISINFRFRDSISGPDEHLNLEFLKERKRKRERERGFKSTKGKGGLPDRRRLSCVPFSPNRHRPLVVLWCSASLAPHPNGLQNKRQSQMQGPHSPHILREGVFGSVV